ncbi:MAG: RnfABCDGE type electron transport complex subunit B [Treponema sp.]|nr:RnfABCDGE type electron transport complex subunit B [Treponema sp.]
MIETILFPVLSIGGLSLLFGALLGFSTKKFAVKVDPKAKEIFDMLPGVNCGGCGFANCSVFAEAVTENKARYNGCPVGGPSAAAGIAETMGITSSTFEKKVAFIKCYGIDYNIKRNYIYDGPKNCVAAAQLATSGNKSCTYSCLGLYSCKNACPYDAIKMVNSIAEVDRLKCTACGKCVAVCPKNLIEIVPDKAKVRVLCNSRDHGKLVRKNCRSGCIACSICLKLCPSEAITIKNNIARVDYDKCTLCMACVNKCPTKAIQMMV